MMMAEGAGGVDEKMEKAKAELAAKQAKRDRMEAAIKREEEAKEAAAIAAAAPDSDEEWLDELGADPELEKIREARMAQLKATAEKKREVLALGHGEYREITEEEFLTEVTSSKQVVVHFYHNEFERCKIMDKHLRILVRKFLHTKFVYLNAEKAPFFVGKLQVRTLPTLVSFIDGVAKDRVVGFEMLGEDDFPTRRLTRRLKMSGVLLAPGQKLEDMSDEETDEEGDHETRRTTLARERMRVAVAPGEDE